MADVLSPVLAYAAGALTILSPCVLPLVPIMLDSAAQAHPRGPLALAGGLVASFMLTRFLLATNGAASGFDGDWIRLLGAGLLIAAGAALDIPAAQGLLTQAATRSLLAKWRGRMESAGDACKRALGGLLVVLGLLIVSGSDKLVEGALVTVSPDWLVDLTTSI